MDVDASKKVKSHKTSYNRSKAGREQKTKKIVQKEKKRKRIYIREIRKDKEGKKGNYKKDKL